MRETVHGTAVLIGVQGILIRGPSGAGKSALALALIRTGGRLVADDRVHLAVRGGRLLAIAPAAAHGMIELRGRGPISVPHERSCVIRLVVDIVSSDALERLPEDAQLSLVLHGVALPRQPVPAALDHALELVRAAIGTLPGGGDMGLRSARLWG
jgi:serine kinase of HPr protein (carbohydrate metabolism regulator)